MQQKTYNEKTTALFLTYLYIYSQDNSSEITTILLITEKRIIYVKKLHHIKFILFNIFNDTIISSYDVSL